MSLGGKCFGKASLGSGPCPHQDTCAEIKEQHTQPNPIEISTKRNRQGQMDEIYTMPKEEPSVASAKSSFPELSRPCLQFQRDYNANLVSKEDKTIQQD